MLRAGTVGAVTKGVRVLVTVGVAFVVWRIGVELVPVGVAAVLALIAGAIAWAVTKGRQAG